MNDNKMRAVVYLVPEQIELRDVPIPTPGPGEMLVRVRAATTCGTDLKTYRRGHPKFPPPFVFGHEFGGDVVALGENVSGFRIGDRVTANVFAECGTCFYCRHGQGNLCEQLVYNFGAFAEYNLIPASIVKGATFVIPDNVSYEEAALVEPLSTVVHSQNLLGIQHGERVVILGAGGAIGLMQQQMALLRGAGQVIAVGHSDARLAVAKELGATRVINAHHEPVSQIVSKLTNGYGADVVIECAGQKSTWELAVDLARRGGRVCWFGGLASGVKVELDAGRLHYGAINLINTHGATVEDAKAAFELITSGFINLRCLLSETLPLSQLELGLKKMAAGEVIKVVIRPDLSSNRGQNVKSY